jgi:hypothetical protein
MNETNMQGLAGANIASGLSAQQYAAARESAQTIVENMMKLHQKEFAAWSWLRRAMEQLPPNKEEEAALWDVVGRARRERY